jgi:hypothetical protein
LMEISLSVQWMRVFRSLLAPEKDDTNMVREVRIRTQSWIRS